MFEKPLYNFLYSLILVLITAAICSYFNRIGMQNFYSELNLSTLTPPNVVFPIVWTLLYAILVISFDMVLNRADKQKIRPAAQAFTLNLFLQALWTFVFFYNAYFLVGNRNYDKNILRHQQNRRIITDTVYVVGVICHIP